MGLPATSEGKGTEPTKARALVSGAPLRIRSGLVWVDGFGDTSLLLAPDRRSCASLSASNQGPHVWAWIHSSGASIRIGRPLTGRGSMHMIVSFAQSGSTHAVGVSNGVRLVVTRIDTRTKGVWHGRLKVDPVTIGHDRYAFNGTFAAHWCGQR